MSNIFVKYNDYFGYDDVQDWEIEDFLGFLTYEVTPLNLSVDTLVMYNEFVGIDDMTEKDMLEFVTYYDQQFLTTFLNHLGEGLEEDFNEMKLPASFDQFIESKGDYDSTYDYLYAFIKWSKAELEINFKKLFKERNLNLKKSIKSYIDEPEMEEEDEEEKTTRSSVEFNGMELLCALLIVEPKIKSFNGLQKHFQTLDQHKKLVFNKKSDCKEYIKDIQKKESIVDEYITNFKKYLRVWITKPVEKVYISGKKNSHKEIKELNKDACKLEAKSDLYIQFKDNSFYGLSVKQSKDCTKSNYSVQKILKELGQEELDEELTKIKKEYLQSKGFDKFKKSERKQVNALFYPQVKDNPYMNRLRKELENYKEEIGEYLIQKMYCVNIDYDIFEFNGEELTKLSSYSDLEILFKEHLPYYYSKKEKERETAKLFYRLVTIDKTYDEEKIYRVEVRWKGNVFSSSPQFQIHEE